MFCGVAKKKKKLNAKDICKYITELGSPENNRKIFSQRKSNTMNK